MKKACSSHHYSLCFNIITMLLLLLLLAGALPQFVVSQNDTSRVEFLPGLHGRLPFVLHTGYIEVSRFDEIQLFYYFIESESNPKEDPLVLWLSGGPGCTSLSALLYEIGPIELERKEYNGSIPKLLLTPHSITKAANVIFLDEPAYAGFAYSTSPMRMPYTDLQVCDQIHQFLQKWLFRHSDFMSNPLYVGGDSYSGITVPIVTNLISDGIEAGIKPVINLKGYILGNPKTVDSEIDYKFKFAHAMGLISDELYTSLMANCEGEYEYIGMIDDSCYQDYLAFMQTLDGINDQNILEPSCEYEFALFLPGRDVFRDRRFLKRKSLTASSNISWCMSDYHKLSNYWANDPTVQDALHIRKGTVPVWERCRQSLVFISYALTLQNVMKYHINLSRKGYRSLIYSGDHDLGIPFTSTEGWIKSLNYSIIEDWRKWSVNGQIAGYTRSYANQMTFATVKGAGHIAFEYKREQCAALVIRWLSRQPL